MKIKNSVNWLLFIPLVSLISGIMLQSIFFIPIFWLALFFGFSIIGLIRAACLDFKPMFIPVCFLFFCVGGLILSLQREHINYLRVKYTGRPLTIVARVIDVQSCSGGLFEGIAHLVVEKIKDQGTEYFHTTNFSFSCYQKEIFDLAVGDHVLFEDLMLSQSSDHSLAGNTPFGDYLIKENIVASVFLQKKHCWAIVDRTKFSINRWIWQQKNRVLHAVKQKVSPLAYSYFALIFLGYKQLAQNHELRKSFNLWGLAHFLARAGLHIMLFIWIWQFFLGLLPVHVGIKRVILFLVCFIYALFSWSSIPFFRAYVVFVLGRTAHFLDQQTNFLHMLTITCMLVLLLNPMQLFFLDFQLTFALTFVLGWFSQLEAQKYTKKKLTV